MPDVETQLRDYFDASVERVTPEDILARRRVTETIRPQRQGWTLHPAWVAVGAFAATVFVLGGAIGLGAMVGDPNAGVGSTGITGLMRDATNVAGGWWLLVAAVAVAVGLAAAVVVRNRHSQTENNQEEEGRMATTIKAPPAEETGTASHNNRGLVITIAVLVVALLALGAWVIYSQTTTAETALSADVQELVDDYNAAWNNYDADAFLALTTESYEFVAGPFTTGQTGQASIISGSASTGWHVEIVGEPISTGEGWRVAMVNQLTDDASPEVTEGISVLSIVKAPDGLKVSRHIWTEG